MIVGPRSCPLPLLLQLAATVVGGGRLEVPSLDALPGVDTPQVWGVLGGGNSQP